jgi:hypothetical protein
MLKVKKRSFVYAVMLDDGVVRVCRMSGVTSSNQLLRKCRIRKKRSILKGYTSEYDSDGVRSKLEMGLILERALIDRLRDEGYKVANHAPRLDSSVYIIELDPAVRKHRDVIRSNPLAKSSLPCLYVGQTRRTPEERFAEHHTGDGFRKGGRHLRGRCLRLRKDLYEFYNPMPLLESLILERDLAEELRLEGYTVLGGH